MRPNALGQKIRSLRKQAGITQRELANKVGVTNNYLSLIELGKKVPSLKRLALIADELGVQLSVLLGDEPVMSELREVINKEELGRLIQRLSRLLAEDEQGTS